MIIVTEEKISWIPLFLESTELLSEASSVQSLIFSKDYFGKEESIKWAKQHGFRHKKVDEKPGTFRIRQASPSSFKRFATKVFRPGLKAVIGYK